jgi:hypothetical protein
VPALPVLMVALGVIWFVIVSWRTRTPTPRRIDRPRRPAVPPQPTPDRLASFGPTPLADEVEEWLRQR